MILHKLLISISAVLFSLTTIQAQDFKYTLVCDGLEIDSTNTVINKAKCEALEGLIVLNDKIVKVDTAEYKVIFVDRRDPKNTYYHIEYSNWHFPHAANGKLSVSNRAVHLSFYNDLDQITYVKGFVK